LRSTHCTFLLHLGSAVFKSIIPSSLSGVIWIILYYATDLNEEGNQVILHPYPLGAIIAALTFLLAFRANFSYNRYWESLSAIHQMHSKWLDVGMELAAFHLQAKAYASRRPPAFGEHPEINCLERAERERLNEPTLSELEQKLDNIQIVDDQLFGELPNPQSFRTAVTKTFSLRRRRRTKKTPEPSTSAKLLEKSHATKIKSINAVPVMNDENHSIKKPLGWWHRRHQHHHDKVPLARTKSVTTVVVQTNVHQKKAWEYESPPLFLQEAAHLLSLLSAVAFSTLRNDLEQADSPLITFTPGAPWPHVDPDAYGADVRKEWVESRHRSFMILKYLFGFSRTSMARTLYNAGRPFRVIGGVSDNEIELLQAARGPLAKVALVTMWLQEFITRESLHGSTGAVAPPILSRLYQFLSDGTLGYNHARKIAYTPL
jgi:hypothetical protein